jgi:translation elongation factor EF-Tu-like GTPase
MNGTGPDVEAELTFLTTEEGGRQSFVLSGYRPQFFYGGEDHVAIQEFLGKERVYPGESVTIHVHLLHPELLYRRMRLGDSFTLREGLRVVAKGRITRILNLVENAELIDKRNPTKPCS